MTSLTSVAVAASVLLHTLLGCCLHHGGDCAADARGATTAAVAGEACGHCHDHATGVQATPHRSGDQPRDSRHDGPRQCEGTHCTFLAGDGAAVDLQRDLVHHWSAVDRLLPGDAPDASRVAVAWADESGGPPPPDRSQPRLCIWRI